MGTSIALLASEGGADSFNPLMWILFLPLVGAGLVLVVPRTRSDAYRQVALTFSALSGEGEAFGFLRVVRGGAEGGAFHAAPRISARISSSALCGTR